MPTLFHLSPERFTEFNSGNIGDMFESSSRTGVRGIYFAPNLRDALKWVGTIAYVKGQKSRNSGPKRRRINEEFNNDKRDLPVKYPPEGQSLYKTLFLYKVEIPHDILKRVKEINKEYEGISFWEPELFVPEDFLPSVKIVSTKKFDTDFLIDWSRSQDMRDTYNSSEGYEKWRMKQFGREETEEKNKVDDYTQVMEARKILNKNFKVGDEFKMGEKMFVITNIVGRNIVYTYKTVGGFGKESEIDVLDFVNSAEKIDTSVIPDTKASCSWYSRR